MLFCDWRYWGPSATNAAPISISPSSIGDTGAKEAAPPGRLVLLLLTVLTDRWRDGTEDVVRFWLAGIALGGRIAPDR